MPLLLFLAISLLIPCQALAGAQSNSDNSNQIFNFKTAPVDMKSKVENAHDAFILCGYRFDEDNGTILSTGTKNPISYGEVNGFLTQISLSEKRYALERMKELLAQQDPNKPVAKEVLEELKALTGKHQKDLPADFSKAIAEAQGLPAKILRTQVDQAYADSLRYWDGQMSFTERVGAALPVTPGGWNEPGQKPAYLDDMEKL